MPEPGRRAAHVLLDAVSVHDLDTPDEVNSEAMNLALVQMEETGAVTATLDAETEEVTVEYSHLIGGAMIVVQRLVSLLRDCQGADREVVIAELREYLDS